MPPEAFTTRRPYLRVQLSEQPLDPEAATRALARLHRCTGTGEDTAPTYEWLFVATGEAGPAGDRHLAWYVGVTDGSLEPVRRALRAALPEGTDLTAIERSYQELLGLPQDAFTEAPASEADTPAWDVAGLRWEGVGTRPADWQYPLPSLASFGDEGRDGADPGQWPLADVLDGLATTDAPAVVQVLITPKPDWTTRKDDRVLDLEMNSDLRRHAIGQTLFGSLGSAETVERAHKGGQRTPTTAPTGRTGSPTGTIAGREPPRQVTDPTIHPSNARRIAALATVDPARSFTVTARAAAFGPDARPPTRTIDALSDGFTALRSDHYWIEATPLAYGSTEARTVVERICDGTIEPDPTRLRHLLPGTRNASTAIVTDPAALGAFCCVDGPAVGPAATRAVAPTPADRTGLPLPPRGILDRYLTGEGMTLGQPLTGDREPVSDTVTLPPSVQPLHTAVFGATGTGKTAVGQTMHLTNHAATDGATIYIDAKGDGAPTAYAQAHFARYGGLDDVYYFDCTEYLPALPFLTVEPLLEAGLDREWAVNTVTEHYIDLLAAAMGPEQFHSAEAAVEVIEQLVRACFDPVHGADSISQTELLATATQFHETHNPPSVSDGTLHQKLASTAASAPTTFDSIMSAVTRRLGAATTDARLAPLFEGDHGTTRFDLRAALDEDCVIVFDLGGYGDRSRTLIAVAILSQLWRALQRRRAVAADDATLPQVNCYLEEAAELATTGILETLLSQGRGFNLALTLVLQFPEQLRDSHPRVYAELLNDVGTIITGNVGVDRRLTERLATSAHDPDAVAARLRALQRGEWLVRPAAPFAAQPPHPFTVVSAPLPAGHPDGDQPLSGAAAETFETAFRDAKRRTQETCGVAIGRTAGGDAAPEPTPSSPPVTDAATAVAAATATIPHTERFPACLSYVDEPPYPLVCPTCETRYAATTEGLRRAIRCHHSLEDVERANVPICGVDLQLTGGERAASPYSDAQLRFLAAVYMAHQRRFDPDLEYDLVWDSMTLLEAYVGIDGDAIQQLLDEGLLRVDCRRPHKLYTVTPEGREAIGVGHREGIAYGAGAGDLSESSLHVAMVAVAARLLAQEYTGPDAPGDSVERYYSVADGRVDVAVLDADGDVVATAEAERINNDRGEAIPTDFDKMAACEPEAAWWFVKTRSAGHTVLEALHEPPDEDPRVPRTYSENMAPREYRLDTPGLTDVVTFEYARDTLLDEAAPTM